MGRHSQRLYTRRAYRDETIDGYPVKARKREVVKMYEEHEEVFTRSLRVLRARDSVFALKIFFRIPL